ncbi:MAG: energy-coupling factor transporter transmembrane component T [Bacillota bacterium]|jgi:energy-coupling factor transport system permease protein|nr:energy-coupling factor transporter transmembrane component T [Bacillota bacterium]HHU29208.1 energy-coupling factor transporter transmembrane protein EcfT [Bacillota bacterium]
MAGKVSLDPRTKIFMVLAISSLAVFLTNIYLLLLVLLLAVAALAFAGGSIVDLLGKLKKLIAIFIAIVFVQSIFTKGGQPLLQAGELVILSDIGLTRGIQTMLRFFIILSSAAIMTTSNPREIIQGLIQCKVPYEIAFMVTVAIRFLPILRDEVNDIMTAIQLRGINLKQVPFLKRLKTYSYLLSPMLSSVFMKSQDLSVAMEMRAFRAYPRRTSLRVLHFRTQDYQVIALCTIIFLAIVFTALKAV